MIKDEAIKRNIFYGWSLYFYILSLNRKTSISSIFLIYHNLLNRRAAEAPAAAAPPTCPVGEPRARAGVQARARAGAARGARTGCAASASARRASSDTSSANYRSITRLPHTGSPTKALTARRPPDTGHRTPLSHNLCIR